MDVLRVNILLAILANSRPNQSLIALANFGRRVVTAGTHESARFALELTPAGRSEHVCILCLRTEGEWLLLDDLG